MANDVVEKLLRKREALDTRIQWFKAKMLEKNRKEDTRRKILAGSYVLNRHQKNNTFEFLMEELDAFLEKPTDRALFGLSLRFETAKDD